MATENRLAHAEAIEPALKLIADISVLIGLNTTELETLMRVAFLRRLAETLPVDSRTKRGPSHEQIGLAAGLNRGEVQNILGQGARSAAARMKKKAQRHSKSEKVLKLWAKNTRYISTSGRPLDLPIELQDGPSFAELVEKTLPGKVPRNVLKDLQRRGHVQLLPDEIVRYRPRSPKPSTTEVTTEGLIFWAEQVRLLGNTLIQRMTKGEGTLREMGIYVASDPMLIPADRVEASQPSMLNHISSFLQGCELEFNRKRAVGKTKPDTKSTGKSKDSIQPIGVSVFTWQPPK